MPDTPLFDIDPTLRASRWFAPRQAVLDVAWAGEDEVPQDSVFEHNDLAPDVYRDRHGETWGRAGSASDRRETPAYSDLFWRAIE